MTLKTASLLLLASAGPGLAHTAAGPHLHADGGPWPVLIACMVIALVGAGSARVTTRRRGR